MPINETIVLVSCVVYIIGIGVCSYYFHSSNDTNRCCRKKVILKVPNTNTNIVKYNKKMN